MASPAKVLVTGASGYIAGHVVKLLQEEGYIVRGTVRSLKNANKIKHLYNICPNAKHKLELVEADLNSAETWLPAVQGMDYVIHVASPFPIQNPSHANELIKPAVEGTMSVLRACHKVRSVKRVVLTSSCVAVGWGLPVTERLHTEADWSVVEKILPYGQSKTLAEKAAWNFVEGLPDDQKFELSVINPSFVLGPPLQGSQCSSVEIIKRMLQHEMPLLPRLNFSIVDVRDVALAHVRALTIPEAAGKRHICSHANMWFSEIATVLKSVFEKQGYSVPTTDAPKFVLWIVGLFDKPIRDILPEIGVVYRFDNTRMRQVLNVEPREVRDTIIEMAYALIEAGFVKKTQGYRGPGGPEERQAYMALKLSS